VAERSRHVALGLELAAVREGARLGAVPIRHLMETLVIDSLGLNDPDQRATRLWVLQLMRGTLQTWIDTEATQHLNPFAIHLHNLYYSDLSHLLQKGHRMRPSRKSRYAYCPSLVT
jgi:hypothetical protein